MRNGLTIFNNNNFWYLNDELHKVDGPAVEYQNGDKVWYQHGKFHRVGGPAFEYADGDNFWYTNGKRHRLDGPAIDGMIKMWYIHGKEFTKKEFKAKIDQISLKKDLFTL